MNKIIQQKYEYAKEVMFYDKCSPEVQGLIRAMRYRPDDFEHIIDWNAFGKDTHKFTLLDKKHAFEMSFYFLYGMFETITPIEYTDWISKEEAVYMCKVYHKEIIDVRNEKEVHDRRVGELRMRSAYASENNN